MKNNQEVWIGKKGIRYWYYRFRDSQYYSFFLIGITIFVCFILIFGVIIPQVSEWFSIRDETLAARKRIALLQNNMTFLSNLDQNKVNTDMTTTTNALPVEKDVTMALASVSNAAITSGVSLNDYTFQVGTIGNTKQAKKTGKKEVSMITMTIVLTGPIDGVRKFIAAIENSLPLATVIHLDGSDQSTALTIWFYQKDFPNIKVSEEQELTSLPAEKLAILHRLQSFKKPIPIDLGAVAASGGALPLF